MVAWATEDVTATADGGASGAESRARQAAEEPISNAGRSQSGRTFHQSRHGPRAHASEHRWLQRESPLCGRRSRERHIQLPGDWRAQSYSGRGRRDPSSRVLLQLTKVAEGNFHSGQNQYTGKKSQTAVEGVSESTSLPRGSPGLVPTRGSRRQSWLRSFPPMRLAGFRAWQRSMPPA